MLYWLKVIALVLELIMEGLSQGEAIHRVADRLGLDPEEIKTLDVIKEEDETMQRYITSGVNEQISIDIQLFCWQCYEVAKATGKYDYLQGV